MSEPDVIGRIKELCAQRSWTNYRLAKESGITYSTLNTLLRKPAYFPSIPTLCRICDGLGITLEQFFAEETPYTVTPEQKNHLIRWNQLTDSDKALAEAYIDALLDKRREDNKQ